MLQNKVEFFETENNKHTTKESIVFFCSYSPVMQIYILVATTLCILTLAIATFLVKKDKLQYDIAKIQSSQVSQLQGLSILKTVSCREMVHELCKTINKYPPTNIVH